MDARASFYRFLPFLVLLARGAGAATLSFTSKCPYTVWPGTLTGGGGGQLSSTGFELATGATFSINDVPNTWTADWVWGRTGCATDASGKFVCTTADCGSGQVSCNGAGAIPPATLAEFTLKAPGSGENSIYDVSLVDGFNLPLSITPQGSGSGCTTTSCAANVNSVCPSELAVKGSDGSIVACKSACLALNQPQYCCTGAYGTPATCPPTNYSKIFKDQCPQAYSYAHDDTSSTFNCTGGASYLIPFCP
ncbi:thaumatin-like protein 1 [Eucalyptus grandis]|uniref:thaumatin-like protein 1 n=1 Tax=Eucalyptus grandis TaxID=71139 RepID=UPI00192EC140|nr:thaumatin-like protein 1 [Eucalyptus grandis]